MAGLPSHIQNRLRTVLMQCAPLNNDHQLQAVFAADARLAQWRGTVPQSYNTAGRVNLLIAQLLDAWDTDSQNALALFLCALYEQVGMEELCLLANEVQTSTIEDKLAGCQQELDQLEDHVRRGWADAAYASRRRAQLEADMAKWRGRREEKSAICNRLESIQEPKQEPQTLSEQVSNQGKKISQDAETNEPYTDLVIRIFAPDPDTETGTYSVKAERDQGAIFHGEFHFTSQLQNDLRLKYSEPEEYGKQLAKALFQGAIRDAYSKAEAFAEAKTNKRLRMRLWIDRNASRLQALAWERLLYQGTDKVIRFATSAERPFSRYLGLGEINMFPITSRPTRMLIVTSNPHNLKDVPSLTPVKVKEEVEALLKVLDRLHDQGLEITLLPGVSVSDEVRDSWQQKGYNVVTGSASLDRIVEQLSQSPGYHVLHYLGHGAYNRKSEKAALFLEDEQGNREDISENIFADKLENLGEQRPRLVFLAACDSAKHKPDVLNPFVGIAPRLIQAGVSAVVAMQDEFPMKLATKFTIYFYRHLFEHGLVDKAINQARASLLHKDDKSWAIPVLLSRLEDGKLLAGKALMHINASEENDIQNFMETKSPGIKPFSFPNPFIHIIALRDPLHFVGRGTELRRLRTLLQGGSVMLLGDPKIGKSSLMWRLAATWADENGGRVLGPLNCQGMFDHEDFFEQLAEALSLAPESDMRALRRKLRKTHGLLLLDEMDCAHQKGLTADDLGLFRAVCSVNPDFRLLTVSRVPLKALFPDGGLGSPAYNFLQPLTLEVMTEADARALLTHPWAADAPTFDAGIVDEILHLAGTHPFKLQRAAHHRYEVFGDAHYDWKAAYAQDIAQML